MVVWGAANNFNDNIILWGYASSTKNEPIESATFQYSGFDKNGQTISKTKIFETVFLSNPSISFKTECSNKYKGSCVIIMKTKKETQTYSFSWNKVSDNNITSGDNSVTNITVKNNSGSTGSSFPENTKLTYTATFKTATVTPPSSGDDDYIVPEVIRPTLYVSGTAKVTSAGMDLWNITVTYNAYYTYNGTDNYNPTCELWVGTGYMEWTEHFTGKKSYSGTCTLRNVVGVACPDVELKYNVGSNTKTYTIYI